MSNKTEIDIDEIKRVFILLEEMNDLFHQSEKYTDKDTIDEFAKKYYSEIRELYYKTVWEWLPKDVQNEFENR